MDIVFATNNPNKLNEIRGILANDDINILSLSDIGFDREIEEPYDSFHENAKTKVDAIFEVSQLPCFVQ